MGPFGFALDTEIRFGAGSRAELGAVLRRYGRRAVLVSGARSFDAHPLRAEISDAIVAGGVELVDRVSTEGEPHDGSVASAAARFRERRAEVIVAIGGGSAIDLAKAAAVVCTGADLERCLGGDPVTEPGLPVVAVPTTGGSGAEASRGAIILHRSAGRKRGLRGRVVAARVAVVDPELTMTAGAVVTADSGFDALAHALETATSRAASPINMLLAGEAIRLLVVAVPAARLEPQDLAARTSAAYAAMLMGINLATSTTCLPHRLQYPVGAATGSSHPRGVAALTSAWLSRTRRYAPERLAALARYARLVGSESDDELAARVLNTVTEKWIDEIDMRTTLSELGVGPELLPKLVGMVEGTLDNDPGPSNPDDLLELYRASL